MRIVVMGTGPFAVPTCQRLLSDGHDLPLVVTRPLAEPRPKKLPPRPVWDWAMEAGLPLFEPASINDASAIETLRSLEADLFFVCDYGQILSSDALAAARLGGINLHGSILPRHRGAAPVQWALLQGDTAAGVTVIHMTPRLDAGPALAVAETLIRPDETAEQLEPRLAELGVAATVDSIRCLQDWDGQTAIGQIQDKSLVTKAPRFAKSDGQLDPRHPAEYIVRLVRACQPWPSTFSNLSWDNGKRLRIMIRGARLAAGQPESAETQVGRADTSRDEASGERVLAVRCGSGILHITHIQPAGKRVMLADEFLRGHPVAADASLELPEPGLLQLTD